MIKVKKYMALLAAAAIVLNACNEKVHIDEPESLMPPVVTGFSPEDGSPGDQIEIYGQHFATVDSVFINNVPIKLVSRISDELIVAEVLGGVPSNGNIIVRSPQGRGSSAMEFFTTYTTPRVTAVPPSAMVNNIVVLKGSYMKSIKKVYFGTSENNKEEAPFSFQYADSVGVLVPKLSSTTAYVFYSYSSSTGDQSRVFPNNTSPTSVNITYPTVAIDTLSAVIPGQTVVIAGANINLVTGLTLGSHTLKVYPYSQGMYELQAKVPVDLPAGTYTLTATTIQGVNSTKTGITSLPAPATVKVVTCNFENYELNALAFNKTIKSGTAQYPIYNIASLENKVVNSAGSITAPEGSKFGRLYMNYTNTEATSLGATTMLGGSTFADLIFYPKNVVNMVRDSIDDPILHFRVNTNGKYQSPSGTITSPVLTVVITMAAGETLPNGATSCMFRLTNWLQSNTTSWHQYAVQLTEISAWEVGNSADKALSNDDKKWGIPKAILDGKVGEIKMQIRGAGSTYTSYEIEVNADDFYMSNMVTPGAIDLTSNLQAAGL